MRSSIIFLALALAACSSNIPSQPVDSADGLRDLNSYVRKFCDQGRAVYFHYNGGLAIVPEAPECLNHGEVRR